MSENHRTASTAFEAAGTEHDSGTQGVSITLEGITKRYDSGKPPAVDGLNLEIPAGSIVMFCGPSGCGKTTTLKMINRLIEPSSGRVLIDGEDVTDLDADRLRRRLGYVIQAGGLFPHMTVAKNIGLVPKMLGWDARRIRARVDELLELVSLDPAAYRDRFPRELSGGQQQRVGVARALAADPPVLLMDEPFGAVDPITRQRLQDELIAIHSELKKTIVCVTHDFDEAVKLGDWIAIFREGGILAQYDSPERILAQPANSFVEDFIGAGAGLKQLSLSRLDDVELTDPVRVRAGTPVAEAVETMRAAGDDYVVVVDDQDRPVDWLVASQLERLTTLPTQVNEDLPVVYNRASLNDALDSMLVTTTSSAIVVGRRRQMLGLVTVDTIMDVISGLNGRAHCAAAQAPHGENTPEEFEIPADDGRTGRNTDEAIAAKQREDPAADTGDDPAADPSDAGGAGDDAAGRDTARGTTERADPPAGAHRADGDRP
ncbi:ABC transporter ATP-binding protein [Brevibacterium sp. p3-SID960]|uniref:ABC transporter ATP-binding protein n=1 Tax=Brevibacterium sp. p3-SID960 TaxID=2916063 RepID=UPI0037BFD20A